MKKINGTLKVVAKTGGLKLEETGEVWMNPTEEVKPYLKGYNKGDKVELTISDDGLVNFIKKISSEPVFQPTKNVNQTNTANVDWDAKDRRIVKQNVLNRAVDMFIAGKIERTQILKIAETFEAWVYDELNVEEQELEE